MDIQNNKVEQLVQTQLMTQILKKAMGDTPAFQMVMESLMKAMQGDNNSSSQSNSAGNTLIDTLNYNNQTVNDNTKKGLNIGTNSSILNGGRNNVSIQVAIDNASKKYGVEKELIKAVIQQESSFDTMSTSSAGAMGLMQLMPGTAKELGVTDAYNVEQNVDGGTKYLSNLLDMYSNSKELALSAYNAGPTTVKNRGVRGSEDIYKMPAETRNYVKKVMGYYGK